MKKIIKTPNIETKEKRLKRFKDGPPVEIILTLLLSYENFFNREIQQTLKCKNRQETLMFLGIHAAALTISEALFGLEGLDGYRIFLEKFMDGNTNDRKFSEIAEVLHNWRNILAHQWIGSLGHSIGYDYTMTKGWEKRDDVVFINPEIYRDCYLAAFSSSGALWKYKQILSDAELEESKNRMLNKYLRK